jgi:hypothetical protein
VVPGQFLAPIINIFSEKKFMRKIFTHNRIKLQILLFALLLSSIASKAQFVERWSNVIPSNNTVSNLP